MRFFHFAPEPEMQFTPVTSNRAMADESGDSAATASSLPRVTTMCVAPLSYSSTGSSDPSTPSVVEERVRIVERANGRHRLLHPPEHERSGLVALDLDGDDPHAGLELDHAALEWLSQNPGRAEDRMARE